jgi:hypothetical protein
MAMDLSIALETSIEWLTQRQFLQREQIDPNKPINEMKNV